MGQTRISLAGAGLTLSFWGLPRVGGLRGWMKGKVEGKEEVKGKGKFRMREKLVAMGVGVGVRGERECS